MKQFNEFIPLIVFFVIYKMYDIYSATAALIAVTACTLLFSWYKYRKVEKMQLITFAMVTVFGGITLFTQDSSFIKWKVTIIYCLFSIVLLVSQYGFKQNLLKKMLGKEMVLPEFVWSRVNAAWSIFFLSLAGLNHYIAFNMSEELWVDFKVFGVLGIMLAFTILTVIYLYRYMPKENSDNK
ncbi:septation protein A [Moritella sp. 5]|uniref:septation protein A n=1 Tax=Moritella sp. 5 TaxID=2746231 RepID=UPI001BA45F24|nr:septation protein A [Moritella sp. 5]QUM79971.1 septation protein A [Moritella sp. 5]